MSTVAGEIVIELIRKSGVQDWNDPVIRAKIVAAANEIAQGIESMALPDVFRTQSGTAKTIKSSGGDAAITLASLANGNGTSTGARQSATLDLGATRAKAYRVDTDFELAATPTAGNTIDLHGSWSDTTGAGGANTSGSDAAYTGYNNNIDASLGLIEFLGVHRCTSQATANIQKSRGAITIYPKGRYLNLVVNNKSGAAFHSSDANCVITLTPIEDVIEDS